MAKKEIETKAKVVDSQPLDRPSRLKLGLQWIAAKAGMIKGKALDMARVMSKKLRLEKVAKYWPAITGGAVTLGYVFFFGVWTTLFILALCAGCAAR